MIRIQQLTMPVGYTREDITARAAKRLRIKQEQIDSLSIRKQSIDARKKPNILLSCVVDITLVSGSEKKLIASLHDKNISQAPRDQYRFPAAGAAQLNRRPVVIGAGPAGLFCGYMLALHGYQPILLERGKDVGQRSADVLSFWNGGKLDPESNVAFGEGGAGTFSDGKLNTLIRDKDGRSRKVLEIFVHHGAQPEILYEARPHIGTDVLTGVVRRMREQIIASGGEVRFLVRVDGILTENGSISGVVLSDGGVLETSCAVLAIGHSARDTFEMLLKSGVPMEAKSFAVGLRVEHPQSLINSAQYGQALPDGLPPAAYKLTARTGGGRGVYSFCMCPGGYVVNASSEKGCLAVNGMSYSRRDAGNANSAIIVSVTPEDYGDTGPLAGVSFQRSLEQRACALGQGKIPVQRYGGFSGSGSAGHVPADFGPCMKGDWRFADLTQLLLPEIRTAFIEGMEQFGRMIPGFDDEDALLSGIESRTSSPVRILRDSESLMSAVKGLYPCGEGAGYAGGIMSAAMDGMRVAEKIAGQYRTF